MEEFNNDNNNAIIDNNNPVPHIFKCPLALRNQIPACSNSEQCGVSCILLWMNHLDECSRCVHHLIDMADQHELVRCNEMHCKKVYACWQFKGDLVECCYKHKLRPGGYVFQRVAKHLELLLLLDFESICYNRPSDSDDEDSITLAARVTTIVFDFLALFASLRQKLTECNVTNIHSDDLVGLLQTIVQQLESKP